MTGAGKLACRFDRSLLTYVCYARGYTAGGFNFDRAACPYQVRSATDPRIRRRQRRLHRDHHRPGPPVAAQPEGVAALFGVAVGQLLALDRGGAGGPGQLLCQVCVRLQHGSDLNPVKLQKAFTVVNARAGVGPQNERWMLEQWAQNLFDKDYIQVAFDATAQSRTFDAFLGQPRTFGATLRAKF